MQSPRFPWELLERVISHSGDYPNLLRSFTLTCRDLVPRSRCMMLAAGVNLKSRDHAFALVDFVQDNPHLKSFITAITVNLSDVPPFPLLRILSHLSDIKFISRQKNETDFDISPSLHPSTLAGFRLFGSHIHTLRLFRITFSTPLELAHLLLAFRSLTHLVCEDVTTRPGRNEAPLAAVKQRLSKQLRLRYLVSDSWCLKSQFGFEEMRSVGDVLFDPNLKLASFTVESLEITDTLCLDDSSHLRLAEWPRLQYLKLYLDSEDLRTRNSIKILENVNSAVCKDVVIQFDEQRGLRDLQCMLSDPSETYYTDLGHVLLKFSQVSVIWSVIPLCANGHHFWTSELRKHFTTVFRCGASLQLVLKSETVFPFWLGHDYFISALTISSDGKWIASGSDDSTIILWDTKDGSIAQQWAFPTYRTVCSLAFCPHSRCLVAGGEDGKAVVWDFLGNGPSRMITTLDSKNTGAATACAWSSGMIIAILSSPSSLQLWDAISFHPLDKLEISGSIGFYPGVYLGPQVMFSPDGRWLTCISQRSTRSNIPSFHTLNLDNFPIITSDLETEAMPPMIWRARTPFTVQVLDSGVTNTSVGRLFVSEEGEPIVSTLDGNLALRALSDGRVKVWDVNARVQLWELIGHKGTFEHYMAHFSPSGKYIVSAAERVSSLLWRVSDGMCVAELPAAEVSKRVMRFAFSPDENILSFAMSDGTVQIHNIPDMISRYSQGQ